MENISYDVLLLDLPYDKEIVEEILELIVDTVCTTKETVRISGDDKPAEVVRSRFLKLDSEHIRFVVGCMKENTTKIKNIRQYLLDELAVLDGSKCILQLRGVRPFLSNKFDITQHKNYRYLSDANPKNEFDIEKFLSHRLKPKQDETYNVFEVDVSETDETAGGSPTFS